MRRCTAIVEKGICRLKQLTNAYGLNPPSFWRGFKEKAVPAVQPHEWGAMPMLPDTVMQAALDGANGDTLALVRSASVDPSDKLASAIVRLGACFLPSSEVSI